MRRINLIQGDQMVVRDPGVLLTTLLGSCIAVCLHDGVANVGGMNHFLLGQPDADHQVSGTDLQRYGVHAMELLINAMMQNGAARHRLRAHIYGGATMVAGLGGIGQANAGFAQRFVATEGIAIGHVDVGGARARKVEFLAHEGKSRATLVTDPVPVQPVRAPALAGGDLELF